MPYFGTMLVNTVPHRLVALAGTVPDSSGRLPFGLPYWLWMPW